MKLFYIWCAYVIIGTLLLFGKAIACRMLGIYHNHYQIGYSPVFARFKILNVMFSIGIIIPLPWLFKIYEIHDNAKHRIAPIWTRREFPLLKRIGGVLGGITFLYLFSILIYALNLYTTEHTYLSMDEVNKSGVCVDSLGMKLGLQTGDKIIKINGDAFEKFTDLQFKLRTNNLSSLTIVRNGAVKEIVINQKILNDPQTLSDPMIFPSITKYPLKIDSVIPGYNGYNAGLANGDKIITLNKDTICCYNHFVNTLRKAKDSSVLFGINRNGQNSLVYIDVKPGFDGRIGIMMAQTLPYSIEKKSFVKSLHAGNLFITDYLLAFKKLFVNEPAYHTLGGFQTISPMFHSSLEMWRILSIILLTYLCWSLIPTPITEGRYLLALLLDKIIRLPANAATWIGWIVFISFMLIANAMDIIRLFL